MKTLISIILVISSLCFSSNSEVFKGCTPSNDRAKRAVEFFLKAPHLEDFRVETGTQNLLTSQIEHVSSPLICNQLQTLVENNADLQNSEEGTVRYFYKAGDFYFIFHRVDKIRLGYSDLNVISKDFQILGMYAI